MSKKAWIWGGTGVLALWGTMSVAPRVARGVREGLFEQMTMVEKGYIKNVSRVGAEGPCYVVFQTDQEPNNILVGNKDEAYASLLGVRMFPHKGTREEKEPDTADAEEKSLCHRLSAVQNADEVSLLVYVPQRVPALGSIGAKQNPKLAGAQRVIAIDSFR